MGNEQRTLSTLLIWGAFTLMMIFGSMDNFLIVGIVGAAAMFSTVAIWESAKQAQVHNVAEKSKRNARERLARLLDQMDDEEMVELDVLLSQRGNAVGYDERRG